MMAMVVRGMAGSADGMRPQTLAWREASRDARSLREGGRVIQEQGDGRPA